MRTILVGVLLCGCGGSAPIARLLPPPGADTPAPPAPPPVVEGPIVGDTPAGDEAARVAELAAKAEVFVDAFSDQSPRLTPDGKKVVFRSNRDGNWQLYVADAARPKDAPVALTSGAERVGNYELSPDGKFVVYASDHGADERWVHYRADLDAKTVVALGPAENAQRDAPMFAPGSKGDVYYFSARGMGEKAVRVYAQAPDAGATPKVAVTLPASGRLAGVAPDAKTAAIVRIVSPAVAEVLLADLAAGSTRRVFPPEGVEAQVTDVAYAADGKSLYVATDGGAETALLLKLDLAGKELLRYVETAPATATLTDVQVSPKGDLVAVRVDAGNHDEIRLVSPKTLKPVKKVTLPLGSVALAKFSADGRRLLGQLATADGPPEIFAIDARTGALAYLRDDKRPGVAGLPPLETSTTTVKSFDGADVPVNLYLPAKAARAPTIVLVHGGPPASAKVTWNANARFFTALGYAVVEPNVRGSTGFGRAWEEADNGPKRLDAVKDMEAVARWAGDQPWGDRRRLVVMGGSYGGYMTLMGLTRQPELWAAGVDASGISSWRTLLAGTTGILRDIMAREIGNPDTDGDFLDSISPIFDLDKVRAPLFVYQGQNDPRVPKSEADQVVRALRKRGISVEYMVVDDEGHSMDRRASKLAYLARSARFLDKNLPRP